MLWVLIFTGLFALELFFGKTTSGHLIAAVIWIIAMVIYVFTDANVAGSKDAIPTDNAPTSATNADHTALPDVDSKLVIDLLGDVRYCTHCGLRTLPQSNLLGESCSVCGNKY